MKLKDLIQNIFSVTNEYVYSNLYCKTFKYKVFTILGKKHKIIYDKVFFNFRFLKFVLDKKKKGKDYAVIRYVAKYIKETNELVENEINNISFPEKNLSSDYVWSCWLQEDIPEIIQICLNSIRNIYPNLIIISNDNIGDYVEIPDYIIKKYEKGIIAPPHFSDYIRICLLDKYGGTWFDASLLLLEKVPEFILKQDFFVLQQYNRKAVSNFFIHSSKNNYLVKSIRIFLETYWKYENITIDYFFFHIYICHVCKNNTKCKDIYNKIITYPTHLVKYFTDNIAQNADEDCWNYLSKNCFMYKLQRKNNNAIKNKKSWYWYLINMFRGI